jgi:hypothetical protein
LQTTMNSALHTIYRTLFEPLLEEFSQLKLRAFPTLCLKEQTSQ